MSGRTIQSCQAGLRSTGTRKVSKITDNREGLAAARTPPEVRLDRDAVLRDSLQECIQVSLVVLDPIRIADDLVERQDMLVLHGEAVLGDAVRLIDRGPCQRQ